MNVVSLENLSTLDKYKSNDIEELVFEVKNNFVSASKNNCLKSYENDYLKILDQYEKIYNRKIYKSDENRQIYYYGFLMAIATIGEELSKIELMEDDIKKVRNRDALIKIMKVLDENGSMFASQIKEELKIKNISTLNNLLERTEKLEVIETKKIGRKRYYYLTYKGRNLIKCVNSKNHGGISKNEFIEFLDEMAACCNNSNKSVLNIIENTFIKYLPNDYIRMSKNKIERIINANSRIYLKNIHLQNSKMYDCKISYTEKIKYIESESNDGIYEIKYR